MNTLTFWFVFFLLIYLASMVWAVARSQKIDAKDTGSLTAKLGMTTFVATLFSTFTLMGMPDFFRNHGVGAWLFLGVTDVAMAFLVLWFGLKVRIFKNKHGFRSISNVLNSTYGGKTASMIYLLGIFVFLIPYVAIQLHGISIFFNAIWAWPEWLTSLLVLSAIFALIHKGGFGAIVLSDAIQWGIVFVTIWIIGVVCLSELGGLSSAFEKLESSNPAWLSTPGPKGLFSWQFLVATFIAIILMPISQPQLTWRVSSFKSEKDLRLGAVGIAIFSFLVILPTLFIGMYGAVFLSESSSPEFWKEVLVNRQIPFIGALAMIGLLAASMSTADSQLHSLRREFTGSVKPGSVNKSNNFIILTFFFLAAYFLSLVATNELVLLARVSFTGTALLAPMVLIAFTSSNKKSHRYIPLITGVALVVFLSSNFGLTPSSVFGVRVDLSLMVTVFILSFIFHMLDLTKHNGGGNE